MTGIRVSNGKYEFRKAGPAIEILRHGEPWITLHDGFNALTSMMCELDAARLVLLACRSSNGPLPDDITEALSRHRALVDDNEWPSEWSAP